MLHISGFEWDDGNILHLELKHGISPNEAEQVFAANPLFSKTKKGITPHSVQRLRVDI